MMWTDGDGDRVLRSDEEPASNREPRDTNEVTLGNDSESPFESVTGTEGTVVCPSGKVAATMPSIGGNLVRRSEWHQYRTASD